MAIIVFAINAHAAPRDDVLNETLKPYAGPTTRGVDTTTLNGMVMCGYQGWFNAEGDGAGRGWVHWAKRSRRPLDDSNVRVDLWPDVSELGPDERFATDLKLPDGKPAEAFSSFKRATVLRHFDWMKEHAIDGVFVQRFITDLRDPAALRHNNTVLGHCREGANRTGRAYVVMYDLSGLGAGRIDEVMADWKLLRTRMKITDDPAYLRHRGKPLVAVWGIGFNDKRAYTLAECRRLVEFLRDDQEAGGCSVMIGVPTYWRELKNDTLPDPALHEIMALADVISPWTVGRYGTPAEAERHAERVIKPDIAWCNERKLDYLPVCFPGFSWHNMTGGPLNQIPRQKGQFLWTQFRAAHAAGAKMLYVAMFDEVDEGTAIFKCADSVPNGETAKFVGWEGLPSDHYLRLTGMGGKLLRGEIQGTKEIP